MYSNTVEWWQDHADLSSRKLSDLYGGDSGSWRKRIRHAKAEWPCLWDCEPKTLKGIAVFDLHYPHQTKKLWDNILAFTADFQPDVFLFGGDNMTMDAVDHWKMSKNKRRPMEGKRLKKEYQGFTDEVMTPLTAVLPEDCRKVFLLGNHEDWVEQYIDSHPEVEGFFEIRNNLPLDDWEVHDYGKSAEVGKLHFIHGDYVNEYSAAKTVRVYHRNVAYGHGHTFQSFTEVTPLDSDAHTAVQIPCACDLNPDYAKNKPHRWLNGFAVFYVREDGAFNLFPVISVDGRFTAPNGVSY